MKLDETFLRRLRQTGLIPPGSSVTVALSGGADSVALLALLRTAAPALDLRLEAAHFHHGLRGAEADRDEAFCRDLCAAWEIPLTVGRGEAAAHAARTGQSVETAARALRYAFLEQAAPDLIATAHTADDNTETLLLHLLRGSGPRGLGGIPPRRGRIVRPLLELRHGELLAYLTEAGIPHVEDSTNAADDCLRNRLRHRVLPLLEAENPRLSEAAGRTAALLRAEDAYLARLAAEAAAGCRGPEGWSCRALTALDPVLRRRILLSLLEELGLESPTEACVLALDRLVTAGRPSGVLRLPGGVGVRRSYDLLLPDLLPPLPPLEPCPLQVPGITVLPRDLGTIACFVTKNLNFGKKNPTTFAVKCDMISTLVWLVRGRAPGDRLHLSGGTKTVKALMIDRKLPRRERDSLPVLLADGRLIGVFGLGLDPAFSASEGEDALIFRYDPPAGPADRNSTQRGRSE